MSPEAPPSVIHPAWSTACRAPQAEWQRPRRLARLLRSYMVLGGRDEGQRRRWPSARQLAGDEKSLAELNVLAKWGSARDQARKEAHDAKAAARCSDRRRRGGAHRGGRPRAVCAGDSIIFFHTPSDLAEKQIAAGERFRLGGLVAEGCVKRGDGTKVEFVVTDTLKTVPVSYEGVLPDLFREGQGVVTEGKLDAGRHASSPTACSPSTMRTTCRRRSRRRSRKRA